MIDQNLINTYGLHVFLTNTQLINDTYTYTSNGLIMEENEITDFQTLKIIDENQASMTLAKDDDAWRVVFINIPDHLRYETGELGEGITGVWRNDYSDDTFQLNLMIAGCEGQRRAVCLAAACDWMEQVAADLGIEVLERIVQ